MFVLFLPIKNSSQKVACGPLALPETLSGVHKVKIIFTILSGYCPFHCVDACNDSAHAKVGQTAGVFALNKVVAPYCACGHCILYH